MAYDVGKMKYEYKYIVPESMRGELRRLIEPFVMADKHMSLQKLTGTGEERLGYTVRSIYYDTPSYQFYHEKKHGLAVRRKLRIRGYNTYDDTNIVFLEIKRKHQKKIFKNRCSARFLDTREFLSSGDTRQYIIDLKGTGGPCRDGEMFVYDLKRNNMMPAVLVIYEREAFFGRFDPTFRITFDKNIRGVIHPTLDQLYEENHVRYCAPGYFVLEVKFYSVYPSWMARIINLLELKLDSFSKYTRCIDAHTTIPLGQSRHARSFLCAERY